jgi:hypothetical protein
MKLTSMIFGLLLANHVIASTNETWTYIRVIDYDSLWGESRPTMDQVLAHLPPAVPENVNFLLLGDSYGKEGSVYAAVQFGKEPQIINIPEIPMGEVETYRKFFTWATQKFPADHYVLSYWGHGGGVFIPEGILGYDSANGGGLTITEFGEVVADLSLQSKKKVGNVFLCTCLNGMAEIAYQIKDSAEFFVAGETSVGCALEPWLVLMQKQDLTYKELADQTVDGFFGGNAFDVVYSAVDLSKMEHLGHLIADLSTLLIAFLEEKQDRAHQILELAAASQNMGSGGHPALFDTYVDLYDLMDQFTTLPDDSIRESARAVQMHLIDRVISNLNISKSDGLYTKAQGLSIGHFHGAWRFPGETYSLSTFAKDTAWGSYLQMLMEIHPPPEFPASIAILNSVEMVSAERD